MVEIRKEIDLLDSWFRIADRDGDGLVGGAEAVDFFQRSGLPKDPLFEIWNAVANGKPFLSKQQFYTAMRLVSAAQRGGGSLSQAEARSILVGLGPALPPPTMAGLEQLKTTVAQIMPEAPAPRPPSATADQRIEAYPPMSGDAVQRYQGLFARLDGDRDGYVLGKECFGEFMQWGLPKEVLREVWNLVASGQGQLDVKQFVSCLYLMDSVKKGARLPETLPTKNFPPLAAGLGADVTVADILAGQAGSDVFSSQIAVAPPPQHARFVTAAPTRNDSRVPPANDDTLDALEYSDKQRLVQERSEAGDLDRSHHEVEAEVATAKQQQAFFQKHLQELTIFKSRTSAALLQAEEWAARERVEATELQQRYDRTYAQAEEQFKGSRTLLADIQAARAKKLELQSRVSGLENDLKEASKLTPSQLRAENGQIAELNQAIAQLETKLEIQDMSGAALRSAIAKLEVYSIASAGKAEEADAILMALDRDLTVLKANVKDGDSDHVWELTRLLAVTTDTYNSLLDQAEACGIPLSAEAKPRVPMPELRLEWDDSAAAFAADWHDFQDEGYKVVSSTTEYSKATATKEAAREVEAAAAARAATAAAVAAQEAHQAAAASVSDEGVDRATGEENGMVDEALEEHASEAGSAGTHHDAEAMEIVQDVSTSTAVPTRQLSDGWKDSQTIDRISNEHITQEGAYNGNEAAEVPVGAARVDDAAIPGTAGHNGSSPAAQEVYDSKSVFFRGARDSNRPTASAAHDSSSIFFGAAEEGGNPAAALLAPVSFRSTSIIF